MPKQETKEIQDRLAELGERLGFFVEQESRVIRSEQYSPLIDVVWYS